MPEFSELLPEEWVTGIVEYIIDFFHQYINFNDGLSCFFSACLFENFSPKRLIFLLEVTYHCGRKLFSVFNVPFGLERLLFNYGKRFHQVYLYTLIYVE